MDFRNIPTTTRRDLFRRAPDTDPPNEPRRRALLGNLALYLLATCVIGIPLVFPAAYLVWLVVDAGLALAVGCLVAYSAGGNC